MTHMSLSNFEKTRRSMALAASDERAGRLIWEADQAKSEIDSGFSTIHAHSLMGQWGSLERFVEDVFKAVIDFDSKRLEHPPFSDYRLSLGVALSSDREVFLNAILKEVLNKNGGKRPAGVTGFEQLLKTIDLDGPIPRKISDAIYDAQSVRNVWAHRAGVADRSFVIRCPHLGFVEGERVDLNIDEFNRLMHGMHMYGVIIRLRMRAEVPEEILAIGCHGYEDVLREVF
jgi:hypothetical protein